MMAGAWPSAASRINWMGTRMTPPAHQEQRGRIPFLNGCDPFGKGCDPFG
jgi:hypothetical protein